MLALLGALCCSPCSLLPLGSHPCAVTEQPCHPKGATSCLRTTLSPSVQCGSWESLPPCAIRRVTENTMAGVPPPWSTLWGAFLKQHGLPSLRPVAMQGRPRRIGEASRGFQALVADPDAQTVGGRAGPEVCRAVHGELDTFNLS